MAQESCQFIVYPEQYQLALFPVDSEIDKPLIELDQFISLTYDPESISLICPQNMSVEKAKAISREWRVLQLKGPFAAEKARTLAKISHLLHDAEIEISVTATYDTDYLLVQDSQLDEAVAKLTEAGYPVDRR